MNEQPRVQKSSFKVRKMDIHRNAKRSRHEQRVRFNENGGPCVAARLKYFLLLHKTGSFMLQSTSISFRGNKRNTAERQRNYFLHVSTPPVPGR